MRTLKIQYVLILIAVINFSCKKAVTVDPPSNQLTPEKVFDNTASAIAATSNIYTVLASADANFVNSSGNYTDELVNQNVDANSLQFSSGLLTAANSNILSIWQYYYSAIYKSNAVIEGLQDVTAIPDSVKKQCTGEAKFIRAYSHFMLTNIFGDIPLITSTDVTISSSAQRTSSLKVYSQIIKDLMEAAALMSPQYPTSGNKIRANKWAATALLAKAYLFNNDWVNAEQEANAVINSGKYSLVNNLNGVFLNNSSEAILQLWNANGFTPLNSVPASGKPSNQLSPQLLASFETSADLRLINWTKLTTVSGTSYNYAYKYKQRTTTTGANIEYAMYLRLADTYLIRAEARSQQSNISGAQADLNLIRNRAGLINTNATDKPNLLAAILRERRIEFFNECGNRFFDLKRSGNITSVISSIKPLWKPTAALFPIPLSERLNDPNLSQNPGYNN